MRPFTRSALLLGITVLGAGCQSPPAATTSVDTAAQGDTIRARMQSYADAIGARDAKRVLAHYVPGAQFRLVSDGAALSYGDMQQLLPTLLDALRATEVRWDSITVVSLGPDAAIAIAPFHRTDTDTRYVTVRLRGAATWVWVRHDGEWRGIHGHGVHYPDSTAD